MKKIVKYGLILLAIALVGYQSVYIKKLSDVKKTTGDKFDAAAFSKKLWDEKLPAKLDSVVELTTLIKAIEANPADAFAKYSNALAIGNYRYALVKTEAFATEVFEDEVLIRIPSADTGIKARLATEFIYGNAIRDASGLVQVKDFPNTADLNSISEEMNKIIRLTVLPSFIKEVKNGDKLNIVAVVELNKEHISFSNLELIPVRLKIVE